MRVALALLIGVAVSTALPTTNLESGNRIVGGDTTTIEQYPFMIALLASLAGNNFNMYYCGGIILNNRSILTAANCFIAMPSTIQWKSRAGSTFANSGGIVYNTQQIILHNNWNPFNYNNDIAIMRIAGTFTYNNRVVAGMIAGPNYNLADNQPVWAAGWGSTCFGCARSEQLRHVQIWTINHTTCNHRYSRIDRAVTDNMLCSGVLDKGGKDHCLGDAGSPLLHNSVVVGVYSWGHECGHHHFPGVSAHVARASNWIQANA